MVKSTLKQLNRQRTYTGHGVPYGPVPAMCGPHQFKKIFWTFRHAGFLTTYNFLYRYPDLIDVEDMIINRQTETAS